MAQILSCVVNERQDDWDVQPPYVELTYNDSVSAVSGLAPNEIHLGRLPRFPTAVSDSVIWLVIKASNVTNLSTVIWSRTANVVRTIWSASTL